MPTAARDLSTAITGRLYLDVFASAAHEEADDQYAVAAGHYSAQRWKLAVEEFQAFLDKYPNHAKYKQSLFFSAEAMVQVGRLEEAAGRFRASVNRTRPARMLVRALFAPAKPLI